MLIQKKLFIAIALIGSFALSASAQEQHDSIRKIIHAEEVIVTSSRTTARAVDLPMSVSSVSSADYSGGRAFELKDALTLVPGVFSQSRSGSVDDRITIRGFGARGAGDRSNAGSLRGIQVIIDGIPETEPDGRTTLDNVDLSAYSHIEVLRSNASTLYGSAAGGVISLFTDLEFTQPFVSDVIRFGANGYMKNSVTTGGLSGTSHFFASLSNSTYTGFRDHSASSAGNASVVVRTQFSPSTVIQVNAAAASNMFRFPGPLTYSQFQTDPSQADSLYVVRDEHRFNRDGRFGLTLDQGLGGGQQISATVFVQPKVLSRSERGTWREFNRYVVGSAGKYSWDAEISESVKSSLLAGFDQQYQDGTILFYALGPGASRSTSLKSNKSEGASNIGGYMQEELTLDAFTVMAGCRYDIIRYSFVDFTGKKPKDQMDFTQLTPKVALSYALGKNSSVYAAFGGGLEAPAYNEIDPPDSAQIVQHGGTYNGVTAFNPFLKPARSTTVEVGAKGTSILADNTVALTYDLALFSIKVTDDIIPWDGGAYYYTAGKTSRTGAELGLAAYFDFGLSARTALTYMNAIFDDYTSDLGTFNGNKQSGVPSLFGRLSLRYDTEFGLYAEAGLNHVGEYYADDRNDKLPDGSPDPSVNSLAPAYTTFDLSLGYSRTLFDVLDMQLFATLNNLSDANYVSSVFINGNDNRYFEPGMPRNLSGGLSLKYRFAQ